MNLREIVLSREVLEATSENWHSQREDRKGTQHRTPEQRQKELPLIRRKRTRKNENEIAYVGAVLVCHVSTPTQKILFWTRHTSASKLPVPLHRNILSLSAFHDFFTLHPGFIQARIELSC